MGSDIPLLSESMKEPSNKDRRYFLIQSTAAVGTVGAGFAVWPFLSYWSPSEKAKALGAPVKIDVSKLQPGEMLTPVVAWRGKPVFIVRRTEAMLKTLKETTLSLADPNSENAEMQPDFAVNPWRSSNPEFAVLLGLCTHLGCSPKLVSVANFEDASGGFFCPCHGSKFDLAGRVVAGVPAPTNMEVPPYRFESENVIVVG